MVEQALGSRPDYLAGCGSEVPTVIRGPSRVRILELLIKEGKKEEKKLF